MSTKYDSFCIVLSVFAQNYIDMENFEENIKDAKKNSDVIALLAITKTVVMGIYSVKILLEKIESDRSIAPKLIGHKNYYNDVLEKAKELLEKDGGSVNEIPLFQKMMIKLSVSTQILIDESDKHIAKMMLKGIEMGVIELIEVKNSEKDSLSIYVFRLLEELLKTLDLFDSDLKSLL